MKKGLSLLKPYLHTAFLNHDKAREKITYLNIPTGIDEKALEQDVAKGAKQFSELEKLLKKEKEPKYILISVDNLEQGYMAVTYLAAGFNRKHGNIWNPEWDEMVESTPNELEVWEENECQIPVITRSELKLTLFGENDPFAMGNTFMMGIRDKEVYDPYWMSCTKQSVCIVCDDTNGYMGFMGGMQESELQHGLEYFKTNDKIYIIVLDSFLDYDYDDEEEFMNYDRGEWNDIVLSFAADETKVVLEKEIEKEYYKLLFQGVFSKKNLKVCKGFSYKKYANIVSIMRQKDKCRLIEDIVGYALKDRADSIGGSISNQDFDFIDRFCRSGYPLDSVEDGKNNKAGARKRMEEELIGLEDVKKQAYSVVNVMKYNRIRAGMKIRGGSYHNVHLMLGAPGTAKTTVARFMGQIMMEEHLLEDNRFICVNGAELKGMYVGHSAPKTKALFEENDIIVIDEAYSLVGDHGENDSFSKEALAQLIIEIENHSTDKLVIFAGYGGRNVSEKNNKMKDFLEANPGIKSRITSTIYFDSYTANEMVDIFFGIAKNQGYQVEKSAGEMIRAHFEKRVSDEKFGNGREARSLLETSVVFVANRVLKPDKQKYTKEEMQTITSEDIRQAILMVETAEVKGEVRQAKRIGFVREGM